MAPVKAVASPANLLISSHLDDMFSVVFCNCLSLTKSRSLERNCTVIKHSKNRSNLHVQIDISERNLDDYCKISTVLRAYIVYDLFNG